MSTASPIDTTQLESLDDLAELVRSNSGVLTVAADVVRNCTPHSRLGSKVREAISNELDELGIRHIPQSFPDRQWDLVRLYAEDTPAGKLITSVLAPGERPDTHIREIAGNEDTRLLESIRQLVCPPAEKI